LVATRAVGEYMSNKSFKTTVDKLNPEEYNDIFKKNYGHDINNAGDLAAAYTLSGLQQKTVKSELKDDNFAQQKFMEGMRQANRKELLAMKDEAKANGAAATDVWIDEYIDGLNEESVPSRYKQDGKWIETKEIALDPVLEKALVVNGTTADFIKLMPDGTYRYGLYERKTGKDGKTVEVVKDANGYSVDKESVRTVSPEALKLALGKQSGVKQMNKEMSAGTKPAATKKIPLPKGQPKTVSQNGFTYTWDENSGTYK